MVGAQLRRRLRVRRRRRQVVVVVLLRVLLVLSFLPLHTPWCWCICRRSACRRMWRGGRHGPGPTGRIPLPVRRRRLVHLCQMRRVSSLGTLWALPVGVVPRAVLPALVRDVTHRRGHAVVGVVVGGVVRVVVRGVAAGGGRRGVGDGGGVVV